MELADFFAGSVFNRTTPILKEHTIRTLFFLAVFGTPSDLDFFGSFGIGAKI